MCASFDILLFFLMATAYYIYFTMAHCSSLPVHPPRFPSRVISQVSEVFDPKPVYVSSICYCN